MIITKSKNFDEVVEALGELGERARTYARRVFSALGSDVLTAVKAKLKPKFWWQPRFKKSLKVGYIAGKDSDMLAVYGDEPNLVRHLNASRMLIWFGNTNNRQLATRADLFKKYEPWTVDTLPRVAGDIYGAKAKIRNMSPGVVTKRRRELRKQMPMILKEMKANKIPIKKGMPKLQNRAVFDLEHALLAQEFFRGGRPIWRPVLRQIQQLVYASSSKVNPTMLLDPDQGTTIKDGFKETKVMNPALLDSIRRFQGKLIGKKVRE